MRYFTFQEFERSATAYRLCIDNSLPEWVKANVAALTDAVLDPLRAAWGGAITVTSGYRCAALNKAVGGSTSSHHLRGMAADISVGSATGNKALFELAQRLELPYCQLIDEKGYRWIHISYDGGDIRREVKHR